MSACYRVNSMSSYCGLIIRNAISSTTRLQIDTSPLVSKVAAYASAGGEEVQMQPFVWKNHLCFPGTTPLLPVALSVRRTPFCKPTWTILFLTTAVVVIGVPIFVCQ